MGPAHDHFLQGRTAVVTGAASGLGRAIAFGLADKGARLLVVDVDQAGVQRIADEVGGTPLVADLSDPVAINALELQHRDVDILVNCAGVQHIAPVEEFDWSQFERLHRLMLHAPFLLARTVLPSMYRRQWGRLVHISSVHGHRASAYKAAYVSAKHGLEGLSKVIAVEGADKGVTSNTVSPGYVQTPLVDKQIADQALRHNVSEDEVIRDVLLSRSPVKRLILPDEVAQMVAFLCGPGTASVNGASFVLDGGWTAT